jgi:hypothetical protein
MNRMELKLAREKAKQRKLDTHNKIQLGGLVVKAKMDKYPKTVILGALLDALSNIENDKDYLKSYHLKGEKAFMNY